MPTAEKAQTIEQAKEWYSKSTGVVFTDYRGLKVKEIQQLRADLRKKGGELHVLKNTLFRLAAGDDAAKFPDELHNGPTAVAFVFQNESECAKTLLDFATSSKKLAVKGGFFSGRAMTAKDVETLSKLPPRDVLIAQVIGAIAAPLSNLVGVVEALYADPIRVIGAVADKVGEGGGPVESSGAEASDTPATQEASAGEGAATNDTESAPAADAAVEAPTDAPAEGGADTNSEAETSTETPTE